MSFYGDYLFTRRGQSGSDHVLIADLLHESFGTIKLKGEFDMKILKQALGRHFCPKERIYFY